MLWTPSVLILDPSGSERYRLEGYVPRDEFRGQLELGRARLAFDEKRWQAAEEIYQGIVDTLGQTTAAAEGVYWAGVCYYKRTQDHTRLQPMAEELQRRYPGSLAAKKALPFIH
ncbi:MAG: hypothetical protein ACRD2D_00220 [Terriglobales bacterium]